MIELRAWLRKIGAWLRRNRLERDLDDELAFHLAMREADHVHAGASRTVARAAARRQFGNVGLVKERARDEWIPPAVQAFAQDLRFATRLLAREPRFTLAVVVALALGIGANTTAFTLLNGAILRPIPLAQPDRLVQIRTVDARKRPLGVSFADVHDWRESTRSLSHVVVSLDFAMNVSDDQQPAMRYLGSFISPEVFDMVGRQPLLGRTYTPAEDRFDAARVAVIAYTVWQSRFGGDPSVVGRTIRVNDQPTTIIGVMPDRFHFPMATEIWMPSAFGMGQPATILQRRGNRNVTTMAFARLADGVSRTQAQSDINGTAARLARDFPATNTGISLALDPLEDLYRGGMKRMLLLTMGAVVIVLLIACVNVANLLLSRSVHRSREIGIRASLGATRWRVVRQLLVESLLLAFAAGAVGLALASVAVSVLARTLTESGDGPPPFWADYSMDFRVYAFLAVLCVITSLLFGLPPALHVSKTNVNEVLKDGGRGATGGVRARRWTAALVTGELALTLVLLTGAALFFRGFLAIYQRSAVLDTSNMVTMRLALGAQRYREADQIKLFYRTLDERLASSRAFSAVTVASDVPMMTLTNSVRQLAIDGRSPTPDETPTTVSNVYIGPRYFSTLRLKLLSGREFDDRDGAAGQETAIVNQRFASMFFPDGNAIGHRIRLANAAVPGTPQPWLEIVGVSPTIPQFVGATEPEPVVYVPVRGEPAPHRFASVIARGDADVATTIKNLREEIRHVDPDIAGYFVQTMDQLLASGRWPIRVFGSIFGLLAAIALLLASVGLYAVTAHGVAQRTQEIGVRTALGAPAGAVVWSFVKQTVWYLGIGLVVGTGGAFMASRLLVTTLDQIDAPDSMIIGFVSALMIIVATTATWLPARRAARVDPVVALRYE